MMRWYDRLYCCIWNLLSHSSDDWGNTHRKSKSEADFVLGNRSLSFWLTALSAHAADMSAWLFMAMPAAIFIGGVPNGWIALGLLLGMFLNWQFVAPRLRGETEKLDSNTLSTFFERRFQDTSGIIRFFTALLSLVYLISYISGMLLAMALLFDSLFGIDFYVGIAISMTVVVIYTYLGGFVAVAWADLFQGIFLLFTILFVPLLGYFASGGVEAISRVAAAKEIPLTLFKDYSPLSFLAIVMLAVSWGIGYFGQPHIITKFMGIRSVEEIKKAKILGMTWQLFALSGAICVGLVGLAYFPEGLPKEELVFVEMVKSLFHPAAAGFILCAILAANISTMDSQILVCASVVTEDFYKKIFRKKATSVELLRVSRFSVIVIGLIASLLALSKSSTVQEAVFYAWGGLGATFGPLVLTSLYAKSANRYGAIAGIIVGGVVAGVWSHINFYLIDTEIAPIIPGFILSFLAIMLVSRVTKESL